METFAVTDFEKVCRLCMKFDKTFLSITSFKIIDMIIACASVQIWENDELPNQICHNCFLQLQNTINFKELCENSDQTFRQIIQQNKINLSNNQNDFNNVKDEKFENYADDLPLINIKEEIPENATNENTLEKIKIKISHNEDDYKKSETEEENDMCEDIQDDENVKTFSCEKCNKEFKKIQTLGQHMHQEHGATALKCNRCKIKCYHPLHLKEHKKLAHNPSNFICQLCDKSFKLKRDLKRHNKEEHSLVEKFVACHICGKSITKKALKRHLETHEERDKLKCDRCSKTFVLQRSLDIHIKTVHEKQILERKHLCNICGFASRKASQLRQHFIMHSTERPYACDRCDKTYKTSDNLKEHVSKVHLNQRKYQCTFCSQAFFERRHLVHHERRHTGEKPHKCEVCGKRFIQKIALKSHMKTHTNSGENLALS